MDHQKQGEVICMESRTHAAVSDPDDKCSCTYDFAVLHSETDESLGELFFTNLEDEYNLKGFRNKRDGRLGILKQRNQIAEWKKCQFIVEIISSKSKSSKPFQRWRSIAYECKKGKNSHPELLPIFIDIPREEQRQYTTTVGRTYSESQEFWDELISYMRGIPPSSPRSSKSSESEHDPERQTSLTNNNLPTEESAAVKYRRKHKVFHGLFSKKKSKKAPASTRASKRVRKSKKRTKRKLEKKKSKQSEKKKTFGFRKLFMCVPTKSDISGCEGSDSYGPPENTQTSSSTARQDSVEGEYRQSSSRLETSRA